MTIDNCNKLKESASIVLVGYKSSGEEFNALVKYKLSNNELKFEEEEQNIIIKSDIQPPKEFIDNLKKQLPIRIYKSNNIKINQSISEQKIIIEVKEFEQSDLGTIINIAKSLLEEQKLPFIFAIGINFSISYELDYKLKLFNEQINQIANWEQNKGFQIIIPLEEGSNILATYRIEKISERNNDNNQKIRTYTTGVNFNYNLPKDKNLDNITLFIDKLYEYHKQFTETNEKIKQIGQVHNAQ